MVAARAACLLISMWLTACVPLSDTNSCRTDDGCPSDEICTDTKECASRESAPAWRIVWTVDGEPSTTPGLCDAIRELALTISSNTESLSYAPISCAVGSFGFAALPKTYDTARLEVRYEDGAQIRVRGTGDREVGAELVLDIALVPGAGR